MSTLGWFNVKDYGATGDGTTDDRTAVNAAIAALNTADKGVLYFPAGRYKITAGLTTITAGCTVLGDGRGIWSETSNLNEDVSSSIECTSATAVLFTITALSALFSNIALLNISGSASAGAAVQASGSDFHQHVDFDTVLMNRWFIGYDCQVNGGFTAYNLWVHNPVKYGVKVRNTVNTDGGGFTMLGCSMTSGSNVGDAGIRIESSGGNKIIGCNINNVGNRAVDITAGAASSILLISACSFENYRGDAGIYLNAGGFSYGMVSVVGCQFGQYANSSGKAVYSTGINDISIADCIFRADTGTPTAISLNSGTRGYVGPMVNNGFGTLLATSSFTSLIDKSAG